MKGKEISLGEVVTIQPGFAFEANRFGDEGDLPLIRIRDVARGFSETYYSGEYDPSYSVENDDLLISMDGEFRVGRWKGGRALLNQRVCRVIPHAGKIDPGYLFYFLPRELGRIEDATPFATVKHLSGGRVAGIKLVLPPLDDQRRIAAILDKADSIRRKNELAAGNLQLLLKSRFFETFGDPEINPKKWKLVPIEAIAEGGRKGVTTGPFGTQLGSRDFVSSGIEVLGIYSIGNRGDIILGGKKYISKEKFQSLKRFGVESGDILFSRMGTVGRVCVVPQSAPLALVSYHLIRIRPVQEVCNPVFLATLLGIKMATTGYADRISHGAIMDGVNASIVSTMQIYLPPIEAQRGFSRWAGVHRKALMHCAAALENSAELALGLISTAME